MELSLHQYTLVQDIPGMLFRLQSHQEHLDPVMTDPVVTPRTDQPAVIPQIDQTSWTDPTATPPTLPWEGWTTMTGIDIPLASPAIPLPAIGDITRRMNLRMTETAGEMKAAVTTGRRLWG